MELKNKQGYKQTEVGLIPEDWKLVPFDEIFTFYSTSNYSKAQMSEDDEVGCIHYGLIHAITNTKYDLKHGIKYYITSEQAKYEFVRDGDVVMVDASEDLEGVNKSVEVFGVGSNKYISGLHTYLLRDKKSLLADNFRGIILNSQSVKNQMLQLAVGMKVFGVSKTQLIKVKLPLPPTLTEQKAIATALSDVDALISSLEQGITKKKAIKQGVMQELLTPPHKGGKRLPGFSEEWNEIRLGDLIHDFQNGYAFSAIGYEDFGIRIITMAQIGLQGQFQFNESKGNYWDVSQLKPLKDFVLKKGDLIMSMTDVTPQKNLIGRMTIIEEKGPFFLNQRVGHLRVNKEKANTVILKHLSNMRSWRTYSKGIASLGVQANIGTTDIKNGTFNLPQIEEQNAIAQILSDMDAEITQLETKKEKYQAIKQGMMQELLTGKTRLV
jgi:type I restriction enzyme S subunit